MQLIFRKRRKRLHVRLLTWVCLILFQAAAYGQSIDQGNPITYSCKDENLADALRQLERLSDFYRLQFTYEDVADYRTSLTLNKATMSEALQAALQGTELKFGVEGRFIQIFRKQPPKAGQENAVSGTVVDETGAPMVGVAIRRQGSKDGVVTDLDGHFTLPLPTGQAILEATFIGKKTVTRKVRRGEEVKLVLEDDSQLMDEVVVTGYQQLDRRHLTSAVTSVKMDDIRVLGTSNLSQMLEGKIPDMIVSTNSSDINATPRLRIRGTSTIIGNREPLWVVDGIIVTDPVELSPDVLNDPDYVNRIGNAISGINPQDIERLDVLKDAAATALYGTKAANGVIVITTKKGRVGKPTVSYSGQATFRRRPYYSDPRIDLMNSRERIGFSQHLVDIHYDYPSNIPLVGYEAALKKLYNRNYTEEEFQAEVARLQTMNTDWFDILTHNSFSQNHNVSISGGSNNIRYYGSVGYTDENDVVKGTTNRRYTGNIKLNMVLSPKFQAEFSLSGYQNDKKYPQTSLNPIDYAYNTSRAIPAYNEDGSYAFYKKPASDTSYMDFNILNELANSGQSQSTNGLTATLNLRYDVTDWAFINAILSGTTTRSGLEGYWGERSFHVAALRKCEYGEVPPKDRSELPYGGELNTQSTSNKSYTARLQGNISKTLGSDGQHYLNIALGAEAQSSHYNSYANTERGYYPDRGRSFVENLTNDYQQYNAWLLGNHPTITDNRTNLLAAYATASYSFRNFFTVNANARYDGSNQFGSRSNEKLLPVWSVSGMVDLSEVFPLKKAWDQIDGLTFKASYGEQGNMLNGQSPEPILKKGSMNSYYNELTSTISTFANPDLRWEKTRTVNLSLEGSFFRNRVQLQFEYYHKRTGDAFMNKVISDVNGFDSYVINSGTMVNRGYNFNATFVPVRTASFNWILSGSLSHVTNEMLTAPGSQAYTLDSFLSGEAVVKGYAIGTFWSYRFLGLNPLNGGPLFDDGEERISELETMSPYETYTTILEPSGPREPTVTGSINNTFTYKAWRLNVGLYYSMGAKTRLFRVFDNYVNGYSSEKNMNRVLLSAWQKPGDEAYTQIPAVMGKASNGYYDYWRHWSSLYSGARFHEVPWDMYDYSNARVASGNYLKVQSLSLTYELPKRVLDAWKMQRVALTLEATNLYTFCDSRLKGQTPTQGGFSEVQLTDTPTYTLGLNINF